MGELLDIGPDTPLVFPKFKGSSTKIGPSQVLLSNSTVRCLDSAQLDRLADTLRADEPGSELQNRLHPGWWVLVASATVGATPLTLAYCGCLSSCVRYTHGESASYSLWCRNTVKQHIVSVAASP